MALAEDIFLCRHNVFTNGSLEIVNLDLPDAGKYQCFATNDAGEAYIAVTLQINSECCLAILSATPLALDSYQKCEPV